MTPRADFRRIWMPRVGATIRDARERQQLTQELLAQRAGVDRSQMGSIELGKHDLQFDTLMKILVALQIEPHTFFRSTGLTFSPPRAGIADSRGRRPLHKPRVGESYTQTLGNALRFEREGTRSNDTGSHTTQAELVARVGIARSTLTNVENGLQAPRLSMILSVLEALAIEPSDFFGRIRLKDADASSPLTTRPAIL